MKFRTKRSVTAAPIALTLALLAVPTAPLARTGQQEGVRDPRAVVAAAVKTELNSNHTDHTAYMYYDHDVTPDHDTLFYVVETPNGNLKKKLQDHGRPLTPEERKADDDRIAKLMADKNAQLKEQKDASHDDEQAEAMLKLLPTAFIWTITGEQGDLTTLDFKPDPSFTPTDSESRVLSAMAGQITVAKGDDRIRSLKGTLTQDIRFGMGLAKLHKNGFFQVERREVGGHHWQITESNVKIEGHALFFKTIGTIEDETRSEFKISTAQNLQQAYEILRDINK